MEILNFVINFVRGSIKLLIAIVVVSMWPGLVFFGAFLGYFIMKLIVEDIEKSHHYLDWE